MALNQYEGIAIVGMAGRFPGAGSVEQFWENLVEARGSISFFTDEELVESGLDPGELRRMGEYIPARGVLEAADCFDAEFFGIHPMEAEVMDPQHRVFLEACWTSLERAGYAPDRIRVPVGVFAGASFNTYHEHALRRRPELTGLVGPNAVMLGNERDYLTSRVAYKLGLRGPALSISTACSTSLVAVCQACQSLLTYQCDMALAGGVSVTVPQKRGYYHDEGNIGSGDGYTRSFDARASGTAFGNGVGVVVLKRTEDAVKDGDRIYAVIRGAALNNDGSGRVSFGAPGVEGQAEVIALAHALAGVDPETIRYVEAHGTATPLGDPIEVAGLTRAFRLGTSSRGFCALGSVKTNIGHLDVAAGVAGLIKTSLALYHRTIPASLNFESPNPKIDFENSPFYVNARTETWTSLPGLPRRAGVSSFGTGGTNAHVVVEEAPELERSSLPSRPGQLLVLSARTAAALDRARGDLAGHLRRLEEMEPEAALRELADTAFTLQTGRSRFAHRRIVVCDRPGDGAAALEGSDPKRVFTGDRSGEDPPVVFMFPGQGSQYLGMGSELYRSEPVFRAEVDRCADRVRPILDADLRSVLFPPSGSEDAAEKLLLETRWTQPALFTVEYALAKLWMSWGIRPAAMIGHSVGEYVAACLAGVFSPEDAITLVARRGKLVQALRPGAMLAVRMRAEELEPHLNGVVSIAAINSPGLCVASGPHEAVADLEAALAAEGIMTRRLETSHAFHSSMMDPVLEPFGEMVGRVSLAGPEIPYISNVTGRWVTSAETRDPKYWAGHVRDTVRFAEGVAVLMEDPARVLLEVGPGRSLTQSALQHEDRSPEQTVLGSLPARGQGEHRGVLETLGRLWIAGVEPDWGELHRGELRTRCVAPTYPFERTRYWPSGPLSGEAGTVTRSDSPVSTPPRAAAPGPAAAPDAVPGAVPDQAPRRERMLGAVRSMLGELSGYDLSSAPASAELLELGLDSLLLTQAATLFQRRFGVRITFRQLMEELSSLEAIASRLDEALPPDAAPAPVPADAPASPSGASNTVPEPAGSPLEQLLQEQQRLTARLEDLIRDPISQGGVRPAAPSPAMPPGPVRPAPAQGSHGPFRPVPVGSDPALTPDQVRVLDRWIARYTRRTATSRKLAAEARPVLADPRSVAGFRRLWKEMVYPIATTGSGGSKLRDVDGNEYVDFVMGFGANLFGHRPAFLVEAIQAQLEQGFEIGPIQPLAGEVARLIREMTGMARVGFTNTGSEAVLAGIRVARTVTGRDKIAVFAGAYHGIFDEVLFRGTASGSQMRTVPIAPGIPDSALAEVIVLDYGDPGALEVLRAHGSELAAVLVEPVQSRRLDLQPREFLHQLRALTSEIGAALVFDEVVTGFRVHPGGAQAWFGVRADLAIYGKVVGGGLPIGVVTGDPKFMDALDGGQWQYGDDSFPEIGVTFFAGTFVRHPLALAAARAVLNHVRESGPSLQERLAERAGQLASRLREVIDERGAPYRVSSFSSLIQMTFGPEQRFAGLVYYLLRERGIHIWENRAFVITTAHTDLDFDRLVDALRDSLDEMRAAGFLPTSAGRDEPWAAFPLTEAQREIWLAAQMAGDAATAYNESLRLEFRGPFDVDAFRQAARWIVERHPILLASIAADGESQRMRSDLAIEIPELDLTGEEASGREAGLEALIEAEVSTPFDLVHGPLLRVRMVRLSPEHHVVIWTAHHIVCDGWSGGLIVDELARIYSALTRGAQPALDAPLSFRDYAGASAAEGPEALEAMKYWQQQLSEPPPPLDLPTDRPRPPTRSVSAATVRRKLDGPLHEALRRTAARHKTTMVALLMAALDTLLYRLTGQTDLVVGLPVAGQPATGSECLVGHCVSLLPVRTRIRGEAAFAETLAEVRKGVLDAYEHHTCTIGGILRNIAVPRSPDRAPLVEVIFNLDRDPGEARFEGVEFSCERNPKRALHYDLFLNAVEGPGGLVLECDYNTGIFDPATMDRWLGHYETLLRSITQNPAGVTSRLEILEERERRELSVEWNDPPVRFPEGPSLQALFEAQVSRTPDARAVTFGEAHLTYRELDSRANQVAHHLIELGVGPEILVGLLLDRSVDMLVGMLGILKAGGAYVPMDPEYPLERIGQILEDSRTPLVVTRGSLSTILKGLTGPAGFTGQVVCMDLDWPVMARQSGQAPGTGVGPANLAYVLFTSGSTGRPKGVAIEHHSAVTFIRWALTVFGQEELAGVLFSTSVCFDLSVFEVFVPLSAGGRVILAPDVLQLPVLPARDEVTLLNTVPSAMMELVRVGGIPPSVTTVNLAGEALRETLVGDICSSTLVERVYNLYGPSEATTYSTFTEVRRGSKVTIGRPIANTRAYVLDGHLNPVPIGVHGELYLAGEGVARGYYGQPDLTRERFLSDPFEPGGGGRMYRTGDLCRWLPDRQLEYLGRMDHQVKLRGFRIELGEIEVALGRHPGVRQAVVVVGPDGSGAAQLVAYVVPEADPAPGAAELREHLRRSLPAFMIPSAIVTLEAIPTTPNGKIDRKSLPAPGRGQIELPIGSAVPRDPIEQGLARLWASVLGVDRIGVDDNFFETGGHSLLALRIVTGIEKTFGKRLPLSTLVQFPTIRELAALLRTNDWTPSWVSLVPIRPGGSRTPLFLMHSHGGNILEYYPLAKLLDADQPVYALQARGLDGHILPNQSIETMAASYVGELRGLQPEGPYVLGGFCFGGMVALEAARQLAGAGQRVALVIMIQTAHPSCGPFRADAGFLHRWWHRLVMRLDLERQLMRQAGPGYIAERGLHVCSVARARAMIAFDRVVVRGGDRPVRSSMAYILESLGIVHDRAYAQYTPRTYGGDVCIIRAASQFPALAGDPWLGWKDTLEGPPELHEVPGHQQNMMVEPNVPLLAEVINSRLRALAPSGDAGKPLDDPIAALAR